MAKRHASRWAVLKDAAWCSTWVGLVTAAVDVLLTLGVFPAGASHLSVLFWEAARLHLLVGAFTLPLAAGLTVSVRKWAPELGAEQAVLGVIALLAGGVAGRFVETALDRKKLEFPEMLLAHEWSVPLAAASATMLTFWVARRVLKKPLLLLPAALLSRLAAVLIVGLIFGSALWLAHGAAAPAYLHQIPAATGAGMTLTTTTTLLLGGMRAPTSPLRFSPALLLALMLTSFPLSKSAAARFTLFGHVPMAGAYGVYFRALTDWDGDGSSATYFGGSDCAPLDATVSPLAREIPEDGIDQDCRGGDAKKGAAAPPPLLLPNCSVSPERLDNIVLLSIDALRADALTPDVTPNLIELGKQASVFSRAYAPSGSTEGSTLSLVTGKTLSDLKSTYFPRAYDLSPADHLLPALIETGFRTAVFVPFAVPDYVRTGAQLSRPRWLDIQPHSVKELTASASLLGGTVPLLRTDANTRTFVWIHLPDLHAPYPRSMLGRSDLSDYEQTLIYVDANIGLFLSSLEKEGVLERTALIVTSDHGEQLSERGREGHGTLLFEEGIRVPLIIHVPGCRRERVTDPVSLIALKEFILRLATASTSPMHVSNPSSPVVVEETGISALGLKRAVIGSRFKLVVDERNGGAMAFDLENDPGEHENIADNRTEAIAPLWKYYQKWLDAEVR